MLGPFFFEKSCRKTRQMRILLALMLALLPIGIVGICQTRMFNPDLDLPLEEALQAHALKRLRKRLQNEDYVYIPVYFHVITSTRGVGNVTRATVKKQLNVLNEVYKETEFLKFTLGGISFTANNKYFNLVRGSETEKQMKRALHRNGKGGRTVLNVYIVNPVSEDPNLKGQPILGWSILPSDVGRLEPWEHSVVISYHTLPGGSYGAVSDIIS
jgi:hypothetical protein